MNTVKKWIDDKGEGYGFKCPGCGHTHHVRTVNRTGAKMPVWGFNGNEEAPTFTPSVHVKVGHFVGGENVLHCEECQEARAENRKSCCANCHSFITNGRIQFLGDCTHSLRGQTVPLAPICERV